MVQKVTSQQGLSLTFHVKWVQVNMKQTTRFHSMQKPKRFLFTSVESPLKLVNFESSRVHPRTVTITSDLTVQWQVCCCAYKQFIWRNCAKQT